MTTAQLKILASRRVAERLRKQAYRAGQAQAKIEAEERHARYLDCGPANWDGRDNPDY